MSLKSHLSARGYRLAKRIARRQKQPITLAIETALEYYEMNHA